MSRFLGVLFCTLILFSASLRAEDCPWFQWRSDGSFTAGGLPFRLVHSSTKWETSEQNSGSIIPDEKFPASAKRNFHLRGLFRLRNGKRFRMEEYGTYSAGKMNWSVKLSSSEGIPGSALYLRTTLPVREFLDQEIRMDGKRYGFGETFQKDRNHFQFNNFVKTIVLPLKEGRLTIRGNFRCRLQDNRQWKHDFWELRILLHPAWGTIRNSELKLEFSLEPWNSVPISLKTAANMGFRDEKAGDRIGGWTDQGPENDLRMFPVGKQKFAGLPFEIVDPEQNGGKGGIVLKGSARPYFPEQAEVVLKKPVKGKYLYLLHGVAWPAKPGSSIGEIRIESARAQFVEKEFLTHDVICGRDVGNFWAPLRFDNGIVAWSAGNASAQVGLYLSRFELGENPISRIVLKSRGRSVWMIAGMTVSDRLLTGAKDTSVIMKAGKDWVPLKNKRVRKGSILDFSFLLDAPSGKYGFLKNRNGRFEFEKAPGKAVRFYGANSCFGVSMMEHELSDRMMDEFAAIGYNLVRFHHFDHILAEPKNGGPLKFREWALDRMDYLVAAAKKRGIYVTLDLYTMRKIQKGEIPGYPEQTLSGDEFKMMTFIDENAMKNFQEFARKLLTHKNKYTGLAWKDDPTIALISFLNEDTIYKISGGFVRMLYEKKFREWCEKRKCSPDGESRDLLWNQFLAEIYRKAFAELRRFAEEIGIRTPVTDQNFWDTIPVTLDRERYDYVDNHFYWGHPVFLGENWRLPMYIVGESSITRFGAISGKSVTRLYGKPFTITEWNYVNPNPYAMEGAFLAGACAAAQDWGALVRFEYSGGESRFKTLDSITGGFSIANCPIQLLSERAGVLFFLRGDVRTSKKNYPILISRQHLKRSGSRTIPGFLSRLSLLGKTGVQIVGDGEKVVLPQNSEFAVAMDGVSCNVNVPLYSPEECVRKFGLDRKQSFVNDTGELSINAEAVTFAVKTSRSEGFVLNPGQSLQTPFTRLSCRLTPAAVLIAAMDSKDLQNTRRYLLLHLTDVKNTGMKFRDAKMTILEDYGKPPQLIRRGEVDLFLQRDLRNFKLHALDFDGTRLFEVPIRSGTSGSSFTLKNAGFGRVVCAYELIQE